MQYPQKKIRVKIPCRRFAYHLFLEYKTNLMKTMILVYTTALLAGTTAINPPNRPTASPAVAEIRTTNTVFNYVHAHRQGRGATVQWSSSATPATVAEFNVWFTYEDPYDPYAEWFLVSSHPCTSSRTYRCTQQPLSGGTYHFKVIASLMAGGTVESEIETVRIMQH
jgi:hypothetical protein